MAKPLSVARVVERSASALAWLAIERRTVTQADEPREGRAVPVRAPRPQRHRRAGSSGATVAEFALIAPIGFLLITTIVVVGIVVTNFIQLTNAARDGVRVAAICAGDVTSGLTPQLPDGTSCSVTSVDAYINARLTSIPSITPTIQVCPAGSSGSSCPVASADLSGCTSGAYLEVTMSFDQPLFLPMVSSFFQTKPNGVRTLQAQAEAACQ
jgi:Flp pilus assembly protein TadG